MTAPDALWEAALSLDTFGRERGDAYNRAVVSRAYYAIFHCVLDRVPGFDGQGPGVHTNLIRHLKQTQQLPRSRQIGLQLDDLFQLRVRSDYFIDQPIARPDVDKALRLGRLIRSQLPAAQTS